MKNEFLDLLAEEVVRCGTYAKERQGSVLRSFKSDGTVITEVDTTISERLTAFIKAHLPLANIVSEEAIDPFDEEAPYTFVIDPIDGTDGYSQGLPTWAVALGILDKKRNPVGAMISAPRMGIGVDNLFIRLDPGKELLINGKPFFPNPHKDVIHQVAMASSGHRLCDFTNFHGKIRVFGSAILHLLAPVIYPEIQGAMNSSVYVWDFCAAHAVLCHFDYRLLYEDGRPVTYTDRLLKERKNTGEFIFAGTINGVVDLQHKIKVVPR
ncbi:MAG: Histidinol-phosphatase [Spirochaetes bacterium ADurb.Bin315]|jgi:fructose-1,6-bisphosphatase/inositol monophosphatase family enzyme|nr:inositol monophosphatase family protein [Spirochaetota bacterium]NLL24337.1 inositol monophosphatase [Spirochaetales bacterium]OQA44323.1 MAG: Histidinol-phosphatase [Spirochaetes bacterium ADurb.Bin315]TAH57534.1 MAG: inositol monophosphatase [Sphaerochaeta sp.]HOE89581.1 inositol monophosphatase family protein [Sphaerochaeta sp.]